MDTKVAEYVKIPGLNEIIRPTVTDRARTITHVCTSGTLCTTSVMEGVVGSPFGSYVDYILGKSTLNLVILLTIFLIYFFMYAVDVIDCMSV